MKKPRSPSSQVVTIEQVIAEALHLCNQKCLEINEVLSAYSWRCSKGKPGVLYKLGTGTNHEATNYARKSYNSEGDLKDFDFWIRRNRFSGVKQIKVVSLFSIAKRLEAMTLSQKKPRDEGVFKATKSGLINKERIRVPHR